MPPAPEWYLLVHQLPPRPAYLRAKVRQRLARVGAVALKNSIYALPARDECREDLQWIAQEARAEGGEAVVCHARFVDGLDGPELVARFRSEASRRYAALRAEMERLHEGPGPGSGDGAAAPLARLRKSLEEARAVDFFDAPGRKEAEAMLKAMETRARGRKEAATPPGAAAGLRGRRWVTRRDIHVDRIATAWLVRRFVDAQARFHFVDVDRPGRPQPRDLRFDMAGGDFTHEGDRCTFETLAARIGLRDPAVAAIGEVVHDLDLKDGKFGRAEAAGFQQVLSGLYARHRDDPARLVAGLELFDHLYASFRSSGGASRPPRRSPRDPSRRSRRR